MFEDMLVLAKIAKGYFLRRAKLNMAVTTPATRRRSFNIIHIILSLLINI